MADSRRLLATLLIGAALLLVGCQSAGPPPVVERSPVRDAAAEHYVVRSGDTLYSIAWRYGLDYRDLARFNGIEPPYRIYPNQRLSLRAPPAPRVATRTPAPQSRPAPQPAPQPSPPATATRPAAQPVRPAESARPQTAAPAALTWQWPAQGRVVRDYGGQNRGIDLELRPGSRVGAVAAGEVVYAGVGLRGFRHLIIIKHDTAYLSAYSLNESIRVREGQRVNAGDALADINGTGTAGMLRFEIRKDGVPVNPRGLLDRRS